MKNIKKVLGSLACVACLSTAAVAEDDGLYLAVELGGGEAKFKQDIDTTTSVDTPIPIPAQNRVGDITANNSMPNLMLKFGDKSFFNENFGYRKYVYFGYGYSSMKNVSYNGGLSIMQGVSNGSIFTTTNNTYYNNVLEYGIGADVLYNFMNKGSDSFGVYAGVAIGGETWIANGKRYKPKQGPGESYANFQTILNVGLRGTIAKNHGIEIGARFYMLESQIFEGHGTSSLMQAAGDAIAGAIGGGMPITTTTVINNTTTKMKRPVVAYLSYVYNF